MAVTEATLLRLRHAEHNVHSIAEHAADSPDPTVRVIARHVLRVESLASAKPADVVNWYAPTLQRYLTGKLA